MADFKASVDRQLAELQRNLVEEHELVLDGVRSTYEQRLQRQSDDLQTIRESLRDQDSKLQKLYHNVKFSTRMPVTPYAAMEKEELCNDQVPDETNDRMSVQIPLSATPSKMHAVLADDADMISIVPSSQMHGPNDRLTSKEVSPRTLSPRGPGVSKPLAMSQADEAIREETDLSVVASDREIRTPSPDRYASLRSEGGDNTQFTTSLDLGDEDLQAAIDRSKGLNSNRMSSTQVEDQGSSIEDSDDEGQQMSTTKSSDFTTQRSAIMRARNRVQQSPRIDEEESHATPTSATSRQRSLESSNTDIMQQRQSRVNDSAHPESKKRMLASSIVSFASKYGITGQRPSTKSRMSTRSVTRPSTRPSSRPSKLSQESSRSPGKVTWHDSGEDSEQITNAVVPQAPRMGRRLADNGKSERRTRATRLCSMRDQCGMFELRDNWKEAVLENNSQDEESMEHGGSNKVLLLRSRAQRLSHSERQSHIVYRQKELIDLGECLNLLVMHPHKRVRASWSLLGIWLVLYDIITVPLLVFEIPPIPVPLMMGMTCYWTLDIYVNFFTGFETNGQIEMRPRKIAQNYTKSWLFLDIVTVLPEWFVIFYDIANPSAVASLGDTFRLTRIFRCARLLRVLKMRHFIEKLQDRLNSEYSRAFFGILKQMVYIVIGDHFLACAWYGLGRWDKRGWVHQDGLLSMSLGYRYLTSLHWSLSQLHGTMEVHPYTANERLFATIVLVFALLCASWIVSSVTNMMIQVQQVKEVSVRDKATLRRFLTEHNVSMALSMRVKNYADELLDRQRAKTREVNVLSQLPPVLRIDLELEIHSKTLQSHGLFHAYLKGYLQAMRSLCNSAIDTLVLFQGNQLFSEGQLGENMYFVIDGSMEYSWQGEEFLVANNEYVSEAVLWIEWVHCGEMLAGGMCNNVLAVKSEKFNEVASGHRRTRNFTAFYAEGFLDKLNQMQADEIHDLVKP